MLDLSECFYFSINKFLELLVLMENLNCIASACFILCQFNFATDTTSKGSSEGDDIHTLSLHASTELTADVKDEQGNNSN